MHALLLALLLLLPATSVRAEDVAFTRILDASQAAFQAKDTAEAEALLEGLTRLRPDDPMAWFQLGELRAALRAARAAQFAYRRAVALAPDSVRAQIVERMVALGLPAPPPREVLHQPDAFLDRVRAVCPDVEAPTCPPTPQDWRADTALVARLLEDPRPWVRRALVSATPLALFTGATLRKIRGDADPEVRRRGLRRVLGGLETLDPPQTEIYALLALLQDEDPQIGVLAATVGFRRGVKPFVSDELFRELVRRIDRGLETPELARAVYRRQLDSLTTTLLGMLRSPDREGKRTAVMLLGLEGGRKGQQWLAQAFVVDGRRLEAYRFDAYDALRSAEPGMSRTLGRSPEEWVEALR